MMIRAGLSIILYLIAVFCYYGVTFVMYWNMSSENQMMAKYTFCGFLIVIALLATFLASYILKFQSTRLYIGITLLISAIITVIVILSLHFGSIRELFDKSGTFMFTDYWSGGLATVLLLLVAAYFLKTSGELKNN